MGRESGLQVAGADDEFYNGRTEVAGKQKSNMSSLYMYLKCNALNETSPLADGGLNILKTSRVLVTTVLANIHGLVGSQIRYILHLGVIFDRGLGADNDLGIRHC